MKDTFALVNRNPDKSCHQRCSTLNMKVPFFQDVYALDETEIVNKCKKLDKKKCNFFVESNFDYRLV